MNFRPETKLLSLVKIFYLVFFYFSRYVEIFQVANVFFFSVCKVPLSCYEIMIKQVRVYEEKRRCYK